MKKTKQCAGWSQLSGADGSRRFPTSVISDWRLEIGHGGRIYTMEICKTLLVRDVLSSCETFPATSFLHMTTNHPQVSTISSSALVL